MSIHYRVNYVFAIATHPGVDERHSSFNIPKPKTSVLHLKNVSKTGNGNACFERLVPLVLM